MRKTKPSQPAPVSARVRFASSEQLTLIGSAAQRIGMSRDRYIQHVLQASSEEILSRPPAFDLDKLGRKVAPL